MRLAVVVTRTLLSQLKVHVTVLRITCSVRRCTILACPVSSSRIRRQPAYVGAAHSLAGPQPESKASTPYSLTSTGLFVRARAA